MCKKKMNLTPEQRESIRREFRARKHTRRLPHEFKQYPLDFKNARRIDCVCTDRSCSLKEFNEFILSYLESNRDTHSLVVSYLIKGTDRAGNIASGIAQTTILAAKYTSETFQKISDGVYEDIWGVDYEPEYDIQASAILTTHVRFWEPLPGGSTYEASRTISLNGKTFQISTIEHEPNECFWGLFKCLTPAQLLDIKDLIEYEPNTRVSLEYASDILGAMARCGISISLQMPDTTLNPGGTHVIRCLLHDQHYWFIDSVSQSESPTPDVDDVGPHFFAYDFETVSKDGRTWPYIISYATESESGCFSTHDPVNEPLTSDITALFAKYCMVERRRPVSFNGSVFDDLLLFRELPNDCLKGYKGNGNSILWYTCYGKKSLDLTKFVKSTLAKACNAFGVEGKFEAPDFDAINRQFENGTLVVSPQMREYAIQDSKCLYALTLKMYDTFKALNINIFGNISIAQCAMRLMRKANGMLWQITNMQEHQFFRSFMVGGKCDAKVGMHRHPLIYLFDFNSLYPDVMTKGTYIKHASDLQPTSEILWHGFYTVMVTKQARVSTLPRRGEDGILDWQAAVPYVSKTMGISVLDHLKYGGTLELIEGYAFKTLEFDAHMFDWMSNLIKLKQDATDPCLREMYKLLINSMSGKLTQEPITEQVRLTKKINSEHVTQIIQYDTDLYGIKSRLETPITTGSLINGMLVYEYARRKLNALIGECENFMYCDTDSVVCTSTFETSDDLGGLKLEAVGDRFLCNGKKSYVMWMMDEALKFSMKGFGKWGRYGDDVVLTRNWEWMERAYREGISEVRIHCSICRRKGLMPNFQDVPKVYTNFVGMQ